eukprot:CAMPEP_0194176102 /NCGR_PEP_ID=MMETSP0154-20130528/10083_1 /TAXON_ID=1049557 /ORGANISM="Thalassiothrix antarctica, Strain L6-D1" /LENGTH=870 /DNA_ID=CAMNT_0038890169 /DNA_START=186 /DNA_END=2795 /DNA_ORIENTATION=+
MITFVLLLSSISTSGIAEAHYSSSGKTIRKRRQQSTTITKNRPDDDPVSYHNHYYGYSNDGDGKNNNNRHYEFIDDDEDDDVEPLSPMEAHLDELRMGKLYDRISISRQGFIPDRVEIEIIFHIIEDENRRGDAAQLWTPSAIEDEVDAINADYEITPFRFKVKRINRVRNNNWNQVSSTNDDRVEDISHALREGGGDVLNIFVVDGLCDGGLGGFAQYPYEQGWFPEGQYSYKDRVFICAGVLSSSDQRSTTTHEIGHWMGLRHTFHGDSCDSNNRENDYVDDTPQHLRNTDRDHCIDHNNGDRVDTCGNRAGSDPVTNFMNYSPCRNEFTPGQRDRMVYQFHEYRRPLFGCDENNEVTANFVVRFDNRPENFQIAYAEYYFDEDGNDDRDWHKLKDSRVGGSSSSSSEDYDEYEGMDFSNQLFSRQVCMPKQKLFVFHVNQEDENRDVGFRNNGFASLSLNGMELEYVTDFDEGWYSTFVVADNCQRHQSLFMLELYPNSQFDDLSFWIRRKSDGRSVLRQEDSYKYTDKAFHKLYYQKCLDANLEYEFNIHDRKKNGIWGYYKLYLNNDVFHQGGGGNGFDELDKVNFRVKPKSSNNDSNDIVDVGGWIGNMDEIIGAGSSDSSDSSSSSSSSDSSDNGDISMAPPNFALCLSGSTLVQKKQDDDDETWIRMEDVQLGDYIRVDNNNKYEPIYAFGHYQPNKYASYLKIITTSNTTNTATTSSSLEISPDHLIFTSERGTIPARLLSVGDSLLFKNNKTSIQIQDIVTVQSKGIYAPFTPSGQFIVNNGILVSSFVSLSSLLLLEEDDFFFYNDDDSSSFMFLGGTISISHHWIAHAFQFPHRLVCYHNQKSCSDATYVKETGMNTW